MTQIIPPKQLLSAWGAITGVSVDRMRVSDNRRNVLSLGGDIADLRKWALSARDRVDWRDWLPVTSHAMELGKKIFYININDRSPAWRNLMVLTILCSVRVRLDEMDGAVSVWGRSLVID